MLLSYCTGRDAQRWAALGECAALEQGLRCIARLHPSALDLYEGGIAMLWQNDPYAGGAFTFCHAHEEAQFAEPARTAEGRIFFAGEHTAIFRRWIQGALESGLRVAIGVQTRAADRSTSGYRSTHYPVLRSGVVLNKPAICRCLRRPRGAEGRRPAGTHRKR